MKKKRLGSRRSDCPINLVLETVGDSWSLLLVRDLMFYGRKSFKEFLDAGEKIATNILTDRLNRLEATGIIKRRRDPSDARRTVYHLTEKGIDLAPMLVEMILWAATHEKTAASPATIREMTQNRKKFIADVRGRWNPAR
jgi:DNA-binding HxlR family transcriptional regulator